MQDNQNSSSDLIDLEIAKILRESERSEEAESYEFPQPQALDENNSGIKEIYGKDNEKSNAVDKKNEERREEGQSHFKKPPGNLSELEFVRLIDPIHIPSYLVEQIKDRVFPVEKFYEYQKIACLLHTATGPQLNPINFLYAITHSRLRQVKGFAYMTLDMLNNTLVIQQFSIDKEFWNRGESLSILMDKCKRMMKDLSIDRIIWATKNAKFCENLGFKKSKESIMTYEG